MKKNLYNSDQSRLHLIRQRSGGQVGIIMLLITVVMLTVGISAISRTTSDVNISTTSEQGSKALDAAETGIEQALSTDLGAAPSSTSVPTSDANVSVQTDVTPKSSLETAVDQGYSAAIDVRSVAQGARINVQWAKTADCTQASLVVTVLSSSATNPVRRTYVGPPGCGRNDGFSTATTLPAASVYRYETVVQIQNGDELIRVRPLYYGTDLNVTSSAALPTQSYTVTSTAQNRISKESKAIQVERTLPVAPTVLDYVLYSGTSITQ